MRNSVFQSHVFEVLDRLFLDPPFFSACKWQPNADIEHIRPAFGMTAYHCIFQDRQAGKRFDKLKSPADTQGGYLMCLEPGDIVTIKDELPADGRVDSRNDVDKGGLASA